MHAVGESIAGSKVQRSPGWPVLQTLGELHNRLSGFAMLQAIWQWYRPALNSFRQRLGLRPNNPTSTFWHKRLTS